MSVSGIFRILVLVTIIAGQGFSLRPTFARETLPSKPFQCDPATQTDEGERSQLISKLSATKTGKELIEDFKLKYGTLDNLHIFWDHVSYSKIIYDSENKATRAVASVKSTVKSKQSNYVCIHLTKKLPQIEHVADLAHELTHAIRLDKKILKGEVGDRVSSNGGLNDGGLSDTEAFVKSRITAIGGEADAFVTECEIKNEILGDWDSLCNPYARNDSEMDHDLVVDALYSGQLLASLTGESYPTMLARQYNNHLKRKR